MFLTPTNPNEIMTIFKTLNDSAAGIDGYNLKIMKEILDSIILPIPKELKTARVMPLFKSDNLHVLNNYRPISILPIISKIMEKCVHKRIYHFLSKNDYIYQCQFGFRERHSTELALIALNHNIISSFNKNKIVLGIFLDFSKAFDTVNFQILIDKLHYYGIRGIPLLWIKNYLTFRTQHVIYRNFKSDAGITKTGVPQGSILGPLLFLVYINDLFKVSKNLFPIMYADDTSLFVSGVHVNELINTGNSELKQICQWLNANKLSLNVKKSKYILFSKSKSLPDPINPLIIDNCPIQRAKEMKFLGYMIDENLKWKSLIQYLCTKVTKMLGILSKLQKTLDTYTLRNLYFTFIHTYLTNGLIVWGSACKTYLDRLIKNEKRALRIITFSSRNAHTANLFYEMKILLLQSLYDSSLAVFIFKIYHGYHPAVICNMFTKNPNQNNRQKHHYKIPRATCKSFETSLFVQGPKILFVQGPKIFRDRGSVVS